MSRPLVVLFGGQSSRDRAMFDRLEAAAPRAGSAWRERATRLVGGDPTDFSSNRTIQISVLAVTLGWLEWIGEQGLESTDSAGLSLGEYAHLVDIGALAPEDALALVAARGALYDAGPDGCMAAIFPVAWEELAPTLARVAAEHGGEGALAPAVFNSPSQTVVAGARAAVDALIAAAEEEHYARGVVIEERIPMHTARFAPVAQAFAPVLDAVRWTTPRAAYWSNVTAEPASASPALLSDRLTRHVHGPVLWRQTVEALAARHPDAAFLEVGPGTVLRDLMARRWLTGREVVAVDTPDAASRLAGLSAPFAEASNRDG